MRWHSSSRRSWALVCILWIAGAAPADPPAARVETKDLGPLGTGSNPFRTGLVHSTGVVYVGTYGPPPALVWKYDPRADKLTKVGAPGEYQLDSMVEAPDGKVYIGTAYEGLVYELDPTTDRIRSLGAPPVQSTPWIFTMVRTRAGEIYGARGVGLFRLDWKTGKLEGLGLVPGEHATPGPGASNPIVRSLEERPDGLLWGDTNRWIFTFDPKTRKITPVADVVAYDEACYSVMHNEGPAPVDDLFFHVYARFSGRMPQRPFGICRARTGKIEELAVAGLEGKCWPCGWWQDGDQPRWLVAQHDNESGQSTLAVVDIANRRVVERWTVPGRDMPPTRLAGPGLWFISSARGTLFRADPARKQLVAVAANPEPVECRCLAASPKGRLGTDTYDCGYVSTIDPATGQVTDHGRVDFDDHRCNYGPAVFAGAEARYFLANHGEGIQRLWATDLTTRRHTPIGPPVLQLVRFQDGTVWGTQGPNPPSIGFEEKNCWTPAWTARSGKLFRYRPGERQVEVMPAPEPVGPLAEAPGRVGSVLMALKKGVGLYDPDRKEVVAEKELPAAVTAVVADATAGLAYLLLTDGTLWSCRAERPGQLTVVRLAAQFGPAGRGSFQLPRSRRLIAIASDGTVSAFEPKTAAVMRVKGPAPLPAGPAVHPTEDAWYFADRRLLRYSLGPVAE